ncbi:hypothetical protein [Hyphomicrobium sp. ghe19]|uniref:hypothetical protein n=1 Tax=Hyphomicrobium sp. ghe19 TaxID=2682968 RepID=UPI00136689F1|nr:hypothetical protein HYPP_01954 [Hyphomicrobium sp. ghe19]
MCILPQGPSTPKLQEPTQYAQQRTPDGDAARSSSSRRTMDRMRAGTSTVLTSGSGVSALGETGKKTLLGQ